MGKSVLLKEHDDNLKKEIARIMREETFYSIRPIDVNLKSYTVECFTYSAKIRVESERGDHVNLVGVICKIYPRKKFHEVTVKK